MPSAAVPGGPTPPPLPTLLHPVAPAVLPKDGRPPLSPPRPGLLELPLGAPRAPGRLGTLAAVALGLLWNERSSRNEIKDGLGVRIDRVETNLGASIGHVGAGFQHTQSIALGTAYATMKALSREHEMMKMWTQQIEAWVFWC